MSQIEEEKVIDVTPEAEEVEVTEEVQEVEATSEEQEEVSETSGATEPSEESEESEESFDELLMEADNTDTQRRITINKGPNRKQRRKKGGVEEFHRLQQASVMRGINKTMKGMDTEMKNGPKWDVMEETYRLNLSLFVPINQLIQLIRNPEYKDYITQEDGELLVDNIALLNKDVPVSLDELERIHSLHSGKKGRVQFDEIDLYMHVCELYSNYKHGFSGTILPTYEHIMDIFRKAENKKFLADNEEKVAEYLNQQEEAVSENETLVEAEVKDE